MVAVLAVACGVRHAAADGGAPVASVRLAGVTWTLLVSPAAPGVGDVEFTLLGPAAPAALLRLQEPDGQAPQELRLESRSGSVGRSARTTLGIAGECRFEVLLEGSVDAALRGTLPVLPPSPPWQARLPWILAWVPLAALLALRAVAVRARGVI